MHRVLVVGTGSIGERHCRCFLATGRAEVAICEVDDSLRAAIQDRYKPAAAYATLDAALETAWGAAVIATPAPWHIPMARRLAEAGTALLVEKPLSTGVDGVDDLIRLVEQRQQTAAVAYVLRCDPALAAMRQAIRSGRFGRPVESVFCGGQHFPTFRPAYRRIYYADRAQGGGAIQDAITHWFNAAEWLVGPVTRMAVDASRQVLEGVPVEDTVHALARHGHVLASYALNQYQAPNESTLTVVCEQGTVRWEAHERRWRWKSIPDGSPNAEPWHDEPNPFRERDDLFVRQANTFLDAVEGRAEPPCTLREGLQTLRVNLAALRSADHGGAWQTLAESSNHD